MSENVSRGRYAEFSYAWRIVVAAALGIGLGLSPIPIYTLGVFAGPLSAEFGWRIDQVFAALPILTLCALIFSPLVGLLICLLYTSPSPRDQRGSRMPSSA